MTVPRPPSKDGHCTSGLHLLLLSQGHHCYSYPTFILHRGIFLFNQAIRIRVVKSSPFPPAPSAAATSFTLMYSEQNSKLSLWCCFHFSSLQSGFCPCHSRQGCKLPPLARPFGTGLTSPDSLGGRWSHEPRLPSKPFHPCLSFSSVASTSQTHV